MADVEAQILWTGAGLSFDASAGGHTIRLDGAGREGPTPVQALLVSLSACTAADVVDILSKMRVPFEGVAVTAEADRAPEPPRRYLRVRMRYGVRGLDRNDEPKLRRAIELSHETYCSVLHTLRSDVEITNEIEIS